MKLAVAGALCALVSSVSPSHAEKAAPPDCYRVMSDACFEHSKRALPANMDELIAVRDEVAKDPWGGAVILVYALMTWAKDPALGQQMLVVAVSERLVQKAKKGGTYKGYDLSRKVVDYLTMGKRYKHCFNAHGASATPDNDYTLDEKSVEIRFRKQDDYVGTVDSGKYKVFVCSTGTDSCRPITLTRNKNGIWKADELSSLFTGCRAPKSASEGSQDEKDAADAL